MNQAASQETLQKAIALLRENTYSFVQGSTTYRRIIPSKDFYVHQWNWDSATHAIGLVHVDEKLAFDEIRSLLSGQWENGLVAQITFNPKEKKYFPGPEFWGTEAMTRDRIVTSGITQPPLLGIAVSYVYRHAKDRERAQAFLIEVLPGVLKYHSYLKKYRDPEDSGLLTIVHPWESGTDNSPVFDEALEQISLDEIPEDVKEAVRKFRTDDKEGEATHRPRLYDYYRYMYLVSLFREWQWDYERIVRESPFAMKSILVSAIWCRANSELASLLEEIGEASEAATYRSWAEQTRAELKASWNKDAQVFADADVSQGKNVSIVEDTIATFLPLYANAVTEEQLEVLLQKLSDPDQYYAPLPVPSISLRNLKFDVARYWRGPSWPITNLFLIDGLGQFAEHKQAAKLQQEIREKTMAIIRKKGFYEYYDPLQGHEQVEDVTPGLGFSSFSWTAAVYLMLYHQGVLQ